MQYQTAYLVIELGLKRQDFFKPLMLFRKIIESLINNPDESPITIFVTMAVK